MESTDLDVENILSNLSNIDTLLEKYWDAETNLEVLERFNYHTYVRCLLKTGRTHQIRVHLLSLGLPIIGDKQYQLNKEQKFRLANLPNKVSKIVTNFPRQALHSHKLAFIHPRSQKEIKITCDLPDDMKDLEYNLQ